MDKIKASVAIIAHNESAVIARCIESVMRFDDIVVLVNDTTSDGTDFLAQSMGARTFREPWKGFGPQKQSAVDKCRHDFVFLIDADECLSQEAFEHISSITPLPGIAYAIRRKNRIAGRWVRHCGWWPDAVVRLFDRRQCRVEGQVHEKVTGDFKVQELRGYLEHYSYRDYTHLYEKLNHYATLSAKTLVEQGKSVSSLAPVIHGVAMFIRTYFIRAGLLDGLDGLAVSVANGLKTFLKYLKVLEMRRLK